MYLLDVINRCARDAEHVEGVVTGHLAEHERAVFDGARHGTAVIERGAAGDDASNGDQTNGWLEPNCPTPGRGATYAAARIRSQRTVYQACRQRRRRPRRRSTRHMIQRPGIPRWPEVRDITCTAEREFMQIQLAHNDRAALLHPDDDLCVLSRHAVLEHRTCRSRARPRGVDVVLQSDWYSMQRPTKLPRLLLGVKHLRLCQCFLAHYRDVAIHLRVINVDPVEQRLHQLRRSHCPRMDHLRDLGKAQRS